MATLHGRGSEVDIEDAFAAYLDADRWDVRR